MKNTNETIALPQALKAFAAACPFFMAGKCFDEFGTAKEERICDLGCERAQRFREGLGK